MRKIISIFKIAAPIFVIGLFLNSQNSAIGHSYYDINAQIKELNQEIDSKKDSINKNQEMQKRYEKAIQSVNAEASTLKNQLAILENRVAKAELDIEITETEIDRVNLEIKKTDIDIVKKNDEIEKEKVYIKAALNLIYKQDSSSVLEILFLNDSLSEFLNQEKYLQDLNKEVKDRLDGLKKLKEDLEGEKIKLADKNVNLLTLKKDLGNKKEALLNEREQKGFLLEQTKNSEKKYQNLLAQARAEQEQAAAEIIEYEKAVRQKIAALAGGNLEFNDAGLIWPVPKNVITAYFHDPDYPFRNIFEHPAVDIRAGQGTPLKAAASGYVARAKDGGRKGYSYIMIVHGDGLSTVYGHVSRIDVSEDDYVVQGQTIGLSGGLPGTSGSGGLTTGPHLHFEVRKDGIPVNPLGYLP